MNTVRRTILWFTTLSIPVFAYAVIPIVWQADKILAFSTTLVFMIAFLDTLQSAIEGKFR